MNILLLYTYSIIYNTLYLYERIEVHTGRKKILPRITRFHFDIHVILFQNVFRLILSSYTCYRVRGESFLSKRSTENILYFFRKTSGIIVLQIIWQKRFGIFFFLIKKKRTLNKKKLIAWSYVSLTFYENKLKNYIYKNLVNKYR